MASTASQTESEFIEAANNWNLEKLYVDMASVKGKSLTPVEKKLLRGLLCGYSPSEIASKVYKSRNSSAVRVYLSNGLYRYIQELITRNTGIDIKIKNWSNVINLLEKAGYRSESMHQFALETLVAPAIERTEQEWLVNTTDFNLNEPHYQDWEEKIDVEKFLGRTEEITQLQQWIVKDICRFVAILGIGGIGKTALAAKIAENISHEFKFFIWRSLRHALPIEELLADLIKFLSHSQEINLPVTVAGKMTLLMRYLRSQRCLLVLDCTEAILSSSYGVDDANLPIFAGYYRPGYQEYGELFRRIAEEVHRSCLIITSREKPKEIAALEGESLPIHSLELNGLKTLAGHELLSAKGLTGTQEEHRILIKRYGGNPLALKIVATTIRDLFDGNVALFLEQGSLVYGDIRNLLEQQFNRLSNTEKMLLYWLAINPKSLPLRTLREEVVPGISKRAHLEAFESLRRRSLIPKSLATWMPPPVLRVYLAEKLVEQIGEEMTNQELVALLSKGIIHSKINSALAGLSLGNIT